MGLTSHARVCSGWHGSQACGDAALAAPPNNKQPTGNKPNSRIGN
jgi:hypothetical protein